jgi:hypothetical protein
MLIKEKTKAAYPSQVKGVVWPVDLESDDEHREGAAKPVAIQPHPVQTVLIEEN